MKARRIVKILVACILGAGAGYTLSLLSFGLICVLGGHSYTEEIYAAWYTAVFAALWGATAIAIAFEGP